MFIDLVIISIITGLLFGLAPALRLSAAPQLVPEIRGNVKLADDLYSVRSGLVHGGSLLHHDSAHGSHLLAFATNEREPMDRLSGAVSVAMVNWLRDQHHRTTIGETR